MRRSATRRLLRYVGASGLALLAVATPAIAGRQDQIARECTRAEQPGVLSSRFSERALRTARREIAAQSLRYTRCWTAVESQLAWYRGRRGRPQEILDDCLRHYGALTRRYSARHLANALSRATPELRGETRCLSGIASQLNVARTSGKSARIRVSSGENPLPLGHDALLQQHRILRRSPTGDDQPSEPMAAAFRDAVNDPQASTLGARYVRGLTGMAMHILPTPTSGACILADFSATTPAYSVICQGGGSEAAAGVFRAPGGFLLVALLLDGADAPQAVDAWGRWRATSAVDGVVAKLFVKPPRLFRVIGSDGNVHYTDLNFSW